MTTKVSNNPVVKAAREKVAVETDAIQTLSTGVRVHLRAVSASLIEEVRTRIQNPPVPIFHDDEKDRDIQNPSDPEYIRKLDEIDGKRNQAATDAMVMFGVELVDPIPDDRMWIRRLALMGIDVDESDELTVEFAYKKYIAVGTPDLPKVFIASKPVTSDEVDNAMATFPGNA